MCTPLSHRIILAVNLDWTHDLKIFNLTLSQLSYSRHVVISNMILRFFTSFSHHIWTLNILNYIVNILHLINIFWGCPYCSLKITNYYCILFVVFGCLFHSFTLTILRTCYIRKTLFWVKFNSIYIFVDMYGIHRTNSCSFLFTPMVYLSNLQIFSLMLSQLSYPRNVVMTDVILGLIVFLAYVEVMNYTQV